MNCSNGLFSRLLGNLAGAEGINETAWRTTNIVPVLFNIVSTLRMPGCTAMIVHWCQSAWGIRGSGAGLAAGGLAGERGDSKPTKDFPV